MTRHHNVFFDLETTGRDPRFHRILQFAAQAVYEDSLELIEEIDIRVQLARDQPYDLEALASNTFGQLCYGLGPNGKPAVPRGEATREYPKGKPLFQKTDLEKWNDQAKPDRTAHAVAHRFLEKHRTVQAVGRESGKRYTVARMGGHNIATFDLPFLKAWYGDRFSPGSFKCVDTFQMACLLAWLRGEEDLGLAQEDLCAKYDIPLVGAHDALVDVRGVVELAKALREDLRAWR